MNWIKVENKIPTYGQIVIVYKEADMCLNQHTVIMKYEKQRQWLDGTITHCMPLPDAPI